MITKKGLQDILSFLKKSIWTYTFLATMMWMLFCYILNKFNIEFRPIVKLLVAIVIALAVDVGWVQAFLLLKLKALWIVGAFLIVKFLGGPQSDIITNSILRPAVKMIATTHIVEIDGINYYVDDFGPRVEFHEYKWFLIQSADWYDEIYYMKESPFLDYPVIYY